MASFKSHGGSCCGAKHIHDFGSSNPADEGLDGLVAQAINGQAVEIILNGTQVASKTHLLAKMDALGFVLDGHWHNGNHGTQTLGPNPTDAALGSHCYRFTRMDRRKALMTGPIEGRWTGMVMTPGLTGLLPPMHGQATADDALRYIRELPRGFTNLYREIGDAPLNGVRVGARVRVSNWASRRDGREFIVRSVVVDNWDRKAIMHDDEEGIDFRLSFASLDVVAPPEPAPRPVVAVGDRVQYIGQTTYSGAVRNGEYGTVTRNSWPYIDVQWDRPSARAQALDRVHSNYLVRPADPEPLIVVPALPPLPPQRHVDAPVQAAPVVLFRTFHNVYSDVRVGAGYDSYEEAQVARGGNGRIDRREYLSDGSTRMVENVVE